MSLGLWGLLVLTGTTLFAQSREELAWMYRQHQVLKLETLHREGRVPFSDWKEFLTALFLPEADVAVNRMAVVYASSQDAQLKSFIRDRTARLYAARGYYESARRIREDDRFFQRILAMRRQNATRPASPTSGEARLSRKQRFGIQVGAYRAYNNAVKARQKFQRDYSDTRILTKVRDGEKLYVVVIGEYPTREKAESALQTIRTIFKVKGYIIQY